MASLGALVTLTHAVDSDERFEVFDNTALGPGEEFFFATSASLINDVVRHTCCVWNFWSLADGFFAGRRSCGSGQNVYRGVQVQMRIF